MKTKLLILLMGLFMFISVSAMDLNNFTYSGKSFNVAGQNINARGVFFNETGTAMYVSGQQVGGVIEYYLSTAWDITTASYTGKFFSQGNVLIEDIYIDKTGTRMFLSNRGGTPTPSGTVYKYTLTKPWDVSSATFTAGDYCTARQIPTGLFFKSDGTKMYTFYETYAYEYTLASAWNLASGCASYTSKTNGGTLVWVGASINNLGTKFYLTETINNVFMQYNTTQPWNISQLAYTGQSLSFNSLNDGPRGMYMSPDEQYMYFVGTILGGVSTSKIYMYNSTVAPAAPPAAPPASMSISYTYPSDDVTNYNHNNSLSFWSVGSTSFPINNVTLYIDFIKIGTNVTTNGTNILTNFSYVNVSQGNHTWFIQYQSNATTANSTLKSIYVDSVMPTVPYTSFKDGTALFAGQNIVGILNATDDLMLYSLNFSLNGNQIIYNNTIGSKNVSYLVNYNATDNLSFGANLFSYAVSDGHTKNKLQYKWDIDTGGMFDSSLTFTINDGQNTINIKGRDDGSFTTKTEIDRITFDYFPKKKNQGTYEFIVSTSNKLYKINGPQPYQSWLISGEEWVDFVVPNQINEKIDITMLDDYTAKVVLSGLDTNLDKISMHSTGEINTYIFNMTLYKFNVSIESLPSVLSGNMQNDILTFTKGNGSFSIGNLNRTYTGLPPISGIITYNQTYTPFQEIWNITYPTPTVANVSSYFINYSWSIGSLNYSVLGNQTIIPLQISGCTADNTSLAVALNFIFYDESNSTGSTVTRVNSTLDLWIELTPVGVSGVSKMNTSLRISNQENMSICLYPNSSVAVGDSILSYTSYNSGYTTRRYYINQMTLSNNTAFIPLYLVQTALSIPITGKVYNKASGQALQGAYVILQRYEPSLGAYHTVEIERSDGNGLTSLFAIPYSVLYKWIVLYDKTYDMGRETPLINEVKLLPIPFSDDTLKSLQFLTAIQRNVTCDRTIKTCSCTWLDPNLITQNVNFVVTKATPFATTVLYDNTIASAAGTMFYTVAPTEDWNNTVFTGTCSLESNTRFSNYPGIIGQAQMSWTNNFSMFGSTQNVLLIAMIFEIVCIFAFIDLGAAGLATGLFIGLVFLQFMGILPITWFALLDIGIILGLIAYKVR